MGFFGQIQLSTQPVIVDRTSPVQVTSLSDVVEVSVSFVHTCARTGDGSVWCWGGNEVGQLGDGTTVARSLPVEVPSLHGAVVDIELGGWHSCARKVDGTLWCWGYNTQGAIGDGTTAHKSVPVQVAALGADVAQVAADAGHTCARKTDGTLWCWGWNNHGQIGDGTTIDKLSPVEISALGSSVTDFALGYWHACARTVDASVWCWGDNTDGQLGDGTTEGRLLPQRVEAL